MGSITEQPGDIPSIRIEVDDFGRRAVPIATPVGEDEPVGVRELELMSPGLLTTTAGAVDEDDRRACAKSDAVEHEPLF